MLAGIKVTLTTALARLQLGSRSESGQALVEYALIISLITIVAIGVLTVLGHNVSKLLDPIAQRI
jgi:Flp pilus assembly pilin Flp